jgi:hypothetical protein
MQENCNLNILGVIKKIGFRADLYFLLIFSRYIPIVEKIIEE